VKTAFIGLLLGLPLLFIAVATRRFGFTVIPTLLASVAGEIFAFALFFFYNTWKAAAILAGKTPGAVAYFPGISLSTRITAWVTVCAFGALIGLIVLLAHYVYSRAQSA
jgi:hypothetical protein